MYLVMTELSFHIKDYNTCTTYLVSIELEVRVANV